jgi:hypothetical protein
VLAEGGYRTHDGRLPGYLYGWHQRVDVASRGMHPAPSVAGVQLGMTGELLRGAQPRAGDPGSLECPAGLVRRQRRECPLDDGRKLVGVRTRSRLAAKRGSTARLGCRRMSRQRMTHSLSF